jgi:hypothetical protein
MKQATALAILKIGANVFLTGEPGAGKTYVINQYIRYLEEHGVAPAVTASTGIAATHIHGMTIHSWAGIGIKKRMNEYELEALLEKKSLVTRIREMHILILDEISMLDAEIITLLDSVLCTIRGISEPFGGMQVVFVGDFFQLPPISKKASTSFAYESEAWKRARPVVCYISEQHRQDDPLFLEVLSSLRKGTVTEEVHAHLEKRVQKTQTINFKESEITRLYTHNEDVDTINQSRLEELPDDSLSYEVKTFGKQHLIESLLRGCLSPEKLVLKKGALVMFTKNNFELGFVNGTLGRVIRFEEKTYAPIVETNAGKRILVSEMEWAIEDQGKVLAKIAQLPLRLAWAITVHKSQGMSLDSAVINLTKAFEYGQGYVALSRVRTLKGLYLEGYNPRALQVHPIVQQADSVFRHHSDVAEVRFGQLESKELTTLHHNFLKAVGGSVKEVEKKPKKEVRQFRTHKKGETYQKTKELLLKKKDVQDIADKRGISERTIWDHVEKLINEKEIEPNDISYLFKAHGLTKKEVITIQQTFKKLETDKLTPVKEAYNDTYTFEQIRLARMLL